MKLAHLILVHKGPEQVKRLVGRLCNIYSDIYIHLDLKCDLADYKEISLIPNVYFINKRVKVTWATYSILQAIFNGFQQIRTTGIIYSHINLLSGQDYPLRGTKEIQDYLFQNLDKSFIDYRLIDVDWRSGQIRIARYSFENFPFRGKYMLEKLVNFILPERTIPMNLTPYGVSGWFTLTPSAAYYVLDFLKKRSSVRRFFKFTWGADEVAVQTILLNSPLSSTIVNDNLRYIELGDKVHPRIFTKDDITLLLNSGKLFARKFDPAIDQEIFSLLDARLDALA